MSVRLVSQTESSTGSEIPSTATTFKPASSLGPLVQFGFHAKTSYDADEALLQTRSESFKLRPTEKDDDIWKRPPPDFRYAVYDPRPPKRNTQAAMQPWRYGPLGAAGARQRPPPRLPGLLTAPPERLKPLVTQFHIDRPFTAKKKFVRRGQNEPGAYQDPAPHDYRQYPPLKKLGLDEFVTKYEKDPFNIQFKSKRLNHIHGLPFEPPTRDLVEGRQMAPPVPPPPQWEQALRLTKTLWPQKSAAYTRHRRRHRAAYSAFLERVEGQLDAAWDKEGRDRQALVEATQ